MRRRVQAVSCRIAIVGLLLLLTGGCREASGVDTTQAASNSAADQGAFPVTVRSCGTDITFDAAPERVVLLGPDTVPLLSAVDALDRVVARAGEFPVQLYDEATRAAVEAIPTFGDGSEADGSGTVQVSLEAVIDQEPDLVIGYGPTGSGVTEESLASVGIPLVVIPAFCIDPADVPESPGFDDVFDQIRFYGKIFGTEDVAAVEADVRQRVQTVMEAVGEGSARTAATLFVYTDATLPIGYGQRSMSNAIIETAGFTNVFGDVDQRKVEVSFEEILDRDPDVITLLYSQGSEPDDIQDAFTSLPGADGLTAVRNGNILVHQFSLHAPPTPLSVEGLELFYDAFGSE